MKQSFEQTDFKLRDYQFLTLSFCLLLVACLTPWLLLESSKNNTHNSRLIFESTETAFQMHFDSLLRISEQISSRTRAATLTRGLIENPEAEDLSNQLTIILQDALSADASILQICRYHNSKLLLAVPREKTLCNSATASKQPFEIIDTESGLGLQTRTELPKVSNTFDIILFSNSAIENALEHIKPFENFKIEVFTTQSPALKFEMSHELLKVEPLDRVPEFESNQIQAYNFQETPDSIIFSKKLGDLPFYLRLTSYKTELNPDHFRHVLLSVLGVFILFLFLFTRYHQELALNFSQSLNASLNRAKPDFNNSDPNHRTLAESSSLLFSKVEDKIIFLGERLRSQGSTKQKPDTESFLLQIHPDDRSQLLSFLQSGADQSEFVFRLINSNNEYLWHLIQVEPSRDSDLTACQVFEVHDLKVETEGLSSRLDRKLKAFHAAQVSLFHYDRINETILLLPEWIETQKLNLSSQTTLTEFLNIVHFEDRDRVLFELKKEQKLQTTVEIDLRIESQDQKYHWYRLSLNSSDPVSEFETTEGSIQNIDSWKSQEASLIQAKREAKGANEAKNNFLAAISHEIRTPLHGILGVTELLGREDLGSRAKSFVQIIQSSGDSLLTLVNDILDHSRIESGNIHLEESNFDLLELCEELQLEFFNRALIKELPLFLSYQSNIPTPLVGDPQRIKQILTNLIGNSIKFTKEGYILMEISLLEIQESGRIWVRMMIEDTGVGIPEQMIGKVFERFTQADDSLSREYGGAGLGLNISMDLVQAMGGEIGLNSEQDSGSSFWVEIPLKLARDSKVEQIQAPQASQVLLVSETLILRRVMQSQLINVNLELDTVSEEEAFQLKKSTFDSYDVVLIEKNVLDNTDLIELQELVAHIQHSNPSIKALLLSFQELGVVESSLQRIGLRGWLHQPITQSMLLKAISNCCSSEESSEFIQLRMTDLEDGEGLLEYHSYQARILLVEDNPVNQKLAIELLRVFEVDVEVANNGQEALEKIQKADFDLVLMDVQMPVMDGYEATREIRKLKGLKSQIPIIALTAKALAQERGECFRAGMNDYLPKPVRTPDFARVFDLYLAHKKMKKIEKPLSTPDADGENGLGVPLPDFLDKGRLEGLLHDLGEEAFLEFYPGFLEELQNQFSEKLPVLLESINQGKQEEASKIAHNLKGVSWNGGFQELGECFLLLEKLDSEDWQNKAKELENQITEQWDKVDDWISSREEKLNRIVFIGKPSNHNQILLKKFLKDKNLKLETKEIHDPPRLREGDILWVDSEYQDRIFEELKSWETPSNLPVVYVTQDEVIDDLEDVDALLIPLEEPLVKRKVRQLITKLETFL